MGLLLFVGFLFQIARVLRRGIKLRWRQWDKSWLIYDVAFLAGLLGLLIGQFLYDLNSETFWFFLGLALTSMNLREDDKRNVAEGAYRGLQ
ncbi:MAG: hypothetical protein QME66_06450 [Candidatus Eisenbacteria bacterium]|nr:hypothetical protein [Candidatus Eisenbacteria bacterium]